MQCVSCLSGKLSALDFTLEMSNCNYRTIAINVGDHRNTSQLKTILDALIARLKNSETYDDNMDEK